MDGMWMKEDKPDNRDKILSCALHLFYLRGYDAVGVQEIADVAGITKPTMYYYFKSKYGLLESLLKEKCCKWHDKLKEAGTFDGDLTSTLIRTTMVYLEMAEEDQEFYFFMLALFYSARGNEAYQAIKPHMKAQFAVIRSIFDQASAILGNMNGRQEQFAMGFSGIIHHYILVYYEQQREQKILKSEALSYALVHQFMHGIFS